MLVLDTNMLSEIIRPEPDRKIAGWIIRQPSDELFTAAVCQAEILSGLAIMPGGRRRIDVEEAARAMFADDFSGRILQTPRRKQPRLRVAKTFPPPGERQNPNIWSSENPPRSSISP